MHNLLRSKAVSKGFIFGLTLLFSAIVCVSSPVQAQNTRRPLMLLRTDKNEIVAPGTVYYDVYVNTMGNELDKIELAVFIVGRNVRASGMTFNLHPSLVSDPTPPVVLDRITTTVPENAAMRVWISMKKNGKNFNEGSAEVPVYRIGVPVDWAGQVTGYLDSSSSIAQLSSGDRTPFDNYTSISQPKYVLATGTTPHPINPVPTSTSRPVPPSTPWSSPSSRPVPPATIAPSVIPTPYTTAVPDPDYDAQIEKLESEIKDLREQTEKQETRLSLVEKIVASIKRFFGNLF